MTMAADTSINFLLECENVFEIEKRHQNVNDQLDKLPSTCTCDVRLPVAVGLTIDADSRAPWTNKPACFKRGRRSETSVVIELITCRSQ